MCPDKQLLSIYVDGELPSPWKEKIEVHINNCPICREMYDNFRHLHELFKKDTTVTRTYVERITDESAPGKGEERTYTEEEMQQTKERIWNNINEKRKYRSRMWNRRLSIPLPAAAAAAVVIALVTGLWIRGETFLQTGFAARQAEAERVDFILAAEENIPIMPTADINGVLQFLTPDGTDIIILRLPESSNFSRTGDPAILRAADYRRYP
ncbi:MAG: zf-HC2 domain-containing protein [Treponema sp.]|nr:zf-HC2 domain-containing protein [Treponema sp.]